jgi:ParB/RepB/Spo0J family partition protein
VAALFARNGGSTAVAHSSHILDLPVQKIRPGSRHRKDMGDLQELARSIEEEGLLQPVGVTEDMDLVFGERRLRACRDILRWQTIPARVVHVSRIVAGEYAENEIRKDFTVSERIAVAKTLEGQLPHRNGVPKARQ